jgi:hypothetical protein
MNRRGRKRKRRTAREAVQARLQEPRSRVGKGPCDCHYCLDW